jgi:hypothetical protein
MLVLPGNGPPGRFLDTACHPDRPRSGAYLIPAPPGFSFLYRPAGRFNASLWIPAAGSRDDKFVPFFFCPIEHLYTGIMAGWGPTNMVVGDHEETTSGLR